MSDRYKTYEEENIEYSYPRRWDKRNEPYLKMVYDRNSTDKNTYPLSVEGQDLVGEPVNPELDKLLSLIINCGDSNEE